MSGLDFSIDPVRSSPLIVVPGDNWGTQGRGEGLSADLTLRFGNLRIGRGPDSSPEVNPPELTRGSWSITPVEAAERTGPKALGEDAIMKISSDFTIIRPSIIFGPGDGFFTVWMSIFIILMLTCNSSAVRDAVEISAVYASV